MPDDRADPGAAPICIFCGEPEELSIFEIWDHKFQISACCEELHASVVWGMADDPDWAKSLLRSLGVEEFTGHRLRRLADNGCGQMLLDWRTTIRPVSFATARAFIARHHAHCNAPTARRYGAGLWNGNTLIGVLSVGSPVARALCGRGILEVNRLCIRRDIPAALAWNAASQLYGYAAREAARRGWTRIVTYTRADEDGTSLIAAGWKQEAVVRGRGWHSANRSRNNTNSFIDKVRWGKALRPIRTRPSHPASASASPAQRQQPTAAFVEHLGGNDGAHVGLG
jgi:hypothetical protein